VYKIHNSKLVLTGKNPEVDEEEEEENLMVV
jgi:hypothetical protein